MQRLIYEGICKSFFGDFFVVAGRRICVSDRKCVLRKRPERQKKRFYLLSNLFLVDKKDEKQQPDLFVCKRRREY